MDVVDDLLVNQVKFSCKDYTIKFGFSIVQLFSSHFSLVRFFTANRHYSDSRHKTNCDGVGICEIRFITIDSAKLCANYEASQVIQVASLYVMEGFFPYSFLQSQIEANWTQGRRNYLNVSSIHTALGLLAIYD